MHPVDVRVQGKVLGGDEGKKREKRRWGKRDGRGRREKMRGRNFSTVQQHSGYLFDDVLSGGECNLDGTLGNWQEEVLHRLLNSRLDTLLQLRVLLQEEDLGEGGGGGEGEFLQEEGKRGNRGFALRGCTLLESQTPLS